MITIVSVPHPIVILIMLTIVSIHHAIAMFNHQSSQCSIMPSIVTFQDSRHVCARLVIDWGWGAMTLRLEPLPELPADGDNDTYMEPLPELHAYGGNDHGMDPLPELPADGGNELMSLPELVTEVDDLPELNAIRSPRKKASSMASCPQ